MGKKDFKRIKNKVKKDISIETNINEQTDNTMDIDIKKIHDLIQQYGANLQIHDTSIPKSDNLDNLLDRVTKINALREQLARLQLSPEEKVYYETEVVPIITLFQFLSSSSYNFAYSAYNISNTSSGKNSRAKDALHLVYDINDIAEDVFKVLRHKIKNLLNISESNE